MILSKIIINTWNSNNKNYYIKKGYIFTKMYDKFEIKLEDLNPNSNKKILVKCDVCNKENFLPYREYLISIKNGGYYSCSQKCSNNKSKITCLKNYGVDTAIKNIEIKNKIKNDNLNKYGVEYYSQTIECKEKVKNTNNIRFGVNYGVQNTEIKEKIKQTCLEKYGVENILMCDEIKEKIKQTNYKLYGFENPFENEKIKEKIKQTCIEKYGIEHHTKNKDIMKKITETQIKKYGELWKNKIPKYNPQSIIFLDLISEKLNIPIQHALNGGEKKFHRYWVDGFISKYNIAIERDEKKHNTINQKEKDIKRQKYIEEHFGCKFIRINQSKFLKNKDENISQIANEIYNLIKTN